VEKTNAVFEDSKKDPKEKEKEKTKKTATLNKKDFFLT